MSPDYVYEAAARARAKAGADQEFITYLVGRIWEQVDHYGYVPDSDELRELSRLAKGEA